MLPPPPLVAHKVCKTACVQSRTYASELQPGRLCPCLALALVTAGLCAPSTWPTSLRQPGPWVCSRVPEFSLRWQRSWWASPVCVHRPFTRQWLPCGLGLSPEAVQLEASLQREAGSCRGKRGAAEPGTPHRRPGVPWPGAHLRAEEDAEQPEAGGLHHRGKATRVGGEPGITRAVMSRIQVCERPLMFLLDTPGVLAPRIPSVETGLKLALCGTVLDHLVGEETLADYLLYTLNRHQLLGYVQHYGLGEACDDIASVLKRVAVKLRKTQKVKVLTGTGDVNIIQPDYPAAARDFLRAFRSGLLGPVMLDRDLLQGRPAEEP
ncbi:mitochondrial ribosome-associated GTPase 1 isoform X4 [Cervus canadensis]|uniref:mitochondrial ribosome-associated GTPase 1 isoform X4 n=1 Tax=Cervus canadensis TaxID=1574408 RepID=UPI001C9E522D|nr:mitochondrial ribosome-associated GTPase 1 isoform X4 [Cervus canadensis]